MTDAVPSTSATAAEDPRSPPVLVWHRRAEHYRDLLGEHLPGVPVDAVAGERLPAGAARAEVLLTWRPPPGGLARLPALRWLHLAGAGADHLLERQDLPADLLLTKTRGRFGLQAAEYVLGWLLHLLLGIEEYAADRAERRWRPRDRPLLADLTIGVVGLGNIGRTVARRLADAGAEVLGTCRRQRRVPGVETVYPAVGWRRMLPRCDALVLALPLTPESRGMIDAAALAALPRGAILVNVARGELVREDALLAALRSEQLGAAVLDVFDEEPLPADHPLWDEPRARITPHVAAPSEPELIADEFARNYRAFADGGTPEPQVDRDSGY